MALAMKPVIAFSTTHCDVGHVFRLSSHRLNTVNVVTARRKAPRLHSTATLNLSITASSPELAFSDGKAIPVGSLVLVAGATGGVGQLTVRRLLDSGFRVRAAARDTAKAESLFGKDTPNLEIVECDLRDENAIPSIMEGVDAVCSCVGTTAFPSTRWKGDNSPEQTDKVAIVNLVNHTPHDIGRFVLISSAGVARTDQFPFVILNLFKVLSYRRGAEERVMSSGVPWTILRPSRLTDAPYTSTDLNSLIRGTRGNRLAVHVSGEDNLNGEASRVDVAEAIVQCLHLPMTANHCYALESVDGEDPPEQDTKKWGDLFSSCH